VTVELVGIDHVQLSMPAGGEDRARRFYGGVLGLGEVEKPVELAGRGGCWFAGLGFAVHLGSEADFRPQAKAHPALLVLDLAVARQSLSADGVPIEEDDARLPVRRCYIRDPFGNRIELVDQRDAGFSEG
jgi:catechol 2,3-dioxygenase-like lactoylglutathione lyase family enzyme